MTEPVYQKIDLENLTLPKFYYVYFAFAKYQTASTSSDEDCADSGSCHVVRRRKKALDAYEIISDPDGLEKTDAKPGAVINCEIVNLTDDKARIFALEAQLRSRKLNIIQVLICNRELARLGKKWSVAKLVGKVHDNRSPATYRRANESVEWFIAELRDRKFIDPGELTEIELVAHTFEALDAGRIDDPKHRRIVDDFRKIYLGSDSKMKINTFRKKYYVSSAQAEQNRQTYPAEEGKKGREIQAFFSALNDLSDDLQIFAETAESAKFAQRAAIFCPKILK